MTLQIDSMSREELARVLDWAAAEGWNPGLDDAAAFHDADPDGFLMGRLNGEPVAAISAVCHSETFGFLGLYICRPEYRGRGYGMALWDAAMLRFGDRRVGLDGVVAQQENYRKSGFALAHQSRRYSGAIGGRDSGRYRRPDRDMLPSLLALDREMAGVARPAYAGAWFTATPSRLTLLEAAGDRIAALGTIRACRHGHKIGPLYAPSAESALALIRALVAQAGAQEVSIDVTESNAACLSLVAELGLVTAFSCARMYKGEAPTRPLERVFGEMTFELG